MEQSSTELDHAATEVVGAERGRFPHGRGDWWPGDVPGMPGVKMKFHYTDEWGDRTVDAVASASWSSDHDFQACQPAIASGSSMVFAGQTLCLTGCFRDPGVCPVTLNGNRYIFPRAFSPTSMQVDIPPDVTPGPNTISYGSSTSFPFTALGMNGSIDQNLLWKGQSTTMRLEVLARICRCRSRSSTGRQASSRSRAANAR